MADKKINPDTKTGTINAAAITLLEKNPEGLRYTQLRDTLINNLPDLHPKTINGCVWLLQENFPDSVYKPEKGLFKHTKYRV